MCTYHNLLTLRTINLDSLESSQPLKGDLGREGRAETVLCVPFVIVEDHATEQLDSSRTDLRAEGFSAMLRKLDHDTVYLSKDVLSSPRTQHTNAHAVILQISRQAERVAQQ